MKGTDIVDLEQEFPEPRLPTEPCEPQYGYVSGFTYDKEFDTAVEVIHEAHAPANITWLDPSQLESIHEILVFPTMADADIGGNQYE